MKNGLLAAGLFVSTLATSVAAAPPITNIDDGMSCKMSFRVIELRTPYTVGQPLGTSPDDVYLDLTKVEDRSSPLCKHARQMTEMTLDGSELSKAGVTFQSGDRFTATVMYQRLSQGLLPLDEWRYVMVIEEGANAFAVLSEFDMQY
jgi:hypothetical protein